jgi:hypothetical protein
MGVTFCVATALVHDCVVVLERANDAKSISMPSSVSTSLPAGVTG